MESLYNDFQHLKWPPDIRLAQLHVKCSGPGRQNPEGAECPCCFKNQKMKVKKWFFRDIIKDFKPYGGGVPAYFQMLKYCGFSLMILAIVIVFFHIYALEKVCSSGDVKCPVFLNIFKFCDSKVIYETLRSQGQYTLAGVFFWLQLGSFLYLILATVGMRWFIQYINVKKIVKQDKIYAPYSLMIKNIPLFYQIDDVRKEIEEIAPSAQIFELFFVYEIAQLQVKYKQLFDLHFQIEFVQKNLLQNHSGTAEQLLELKENYIRLYTEVQLERKKLYVNNGRAIIVFNETKDRDKVYQTLKIGECEKLTYHTKKLLGKNTRNLHFFADKIVEPQQVLWNYIGESSASKTKVRIQTTIIGVGFMILCFLVLYFPIVYSDEAKIKDKGGVGSFLSIILALVIQILAIVYRLIIMKLIPSRQPSSRQSESYFIVITTVVFHFFFYLVAPATYYILAYKIPNSVKLLQLFVTVMMFLCMTILAAFIDLRFRIFNSRRKKIMSSWAFWGKFCQIRLHEQIRWPSFPIEFKLMVILNIWAFNAFYIFQIPYLLFMFVLVMIIVFWVDKKNIYKHYRMQTFLSIELEQTVLRDFLFMFLITVCCGYAISAIFTWQYVFIGVIFIFSIVLNIMLNFQIKYSKNQTSEATRALTISEMLKTQTNNPKQSMLDNIREQMFVFESNASTNSMASASFQYGYKEMYDNYLTQFSNKHILKTLETTFYLYNKKVESDNSTIFSHTESKRKLSKVSQLEDFNSRHSKMKLDEKQQSAAGDDEPVQKQEVKQSLKQQDVSFNSNNGMKEDEEIEEISEEEKQKIQQNNISQ